MELLDGLKVVLVHHRIDCDVFKINRPSAIHHDLTICLKGKMRYSVGDESMTLSAGEAMYCPPHVHLIREDGTKASYISLNFIMPKKDPLPIGSYIHNVLAHEINTYIELISYFLREPNKHNDEKLYHLVMLILIKIIEQQEIAHPMPYVDRMKVYICNNFQKDITLDTVAKYINLHPSYCSTIFRRNEGISVVEYINQMRISYAKELLETTNYRVGEVGSMCGISDPYYFSRVFSKLSGVSPTEYRRIAKTYGGKHYTYEA